MAAYKTGAFVRSKYYTPSRNGYPVPNQELQNQEPRWAAHTRIGNLWEYLPPPGV